MFDPEIRLADVVELLPTPVLLVRDDGRIESASRSARERLGLTSSACAVRLVDKLAEPSDKFERYLRMCGRNLSAIPGRFTLLEDGGSRQAFRFSGARIRHPSTEPRLICLVLEELDAASPQRGFVALNETIDQLKLEIHARRRAEAMLEAQKETLARVVERRPLGEALTILCEAVEAHSGGMLVSVLLLDEHDHLHHSAAPSLPADYLAAIDGVEIGPEVGSCGTAAYTGRQVIVEDIATDPRWRAFRDTAMAAGLAACWSTPIRGSTGDILGTVALYYASPRTPSDEQLKLVDACLHIAALAIERDRILERESLLLVEAQRERERAEAESRAKDMFLSVLSHELRNPLSAIANSANALADRDNGDPASEELHRIILNGAHFLTRLVDDLLDITRLREGKLKLQFETFDIADLLEELRAALLASYPERSIVAHFDGASGPVHADRFRVRQILQNLVDNAVKYSAPDTSVHLSVSADDGEIRASVRDSGEGIPAELLPRIFDPFVQSDRSIARSQSGLGLGLALVKRICDMHGGTIEISSEGLDHGSEAVLRLPRGKVEKRPQTRVNSHVTSDREVVAKRVLLVEDNVDVRTALSALMRRWGHEVCCASDGSEALEIIGNRPLDIAFVDIGLPVLDGYEVAKAVRRDRQLDRTYLVALTGYGQDSDRRRVREAGFDTHLTKPADKADLIELLAK